jgi:acyl carrier protein
MARLTLVTASEAVHRLWFETLGRELVDVDVDVFDLGADSLSLIRFLDLAETRLGLVLDLAELLEHRTIRAQTELVVERLMSPPAD